MMSTVVLFVMLVVLIVSLALVFFCYQNQANNRLRELQQERDSDAVHAAVIYSRPSYPPRGPYNSRPAEQRVYLRKFPTPPTITRNLPCLKYDGAKSSSDEAPQCVICCCEYELGEEIKLLPCMHMFHVECIDLWLERDHSCPICQADIVLAAGLSDRDWSEHTLASINTVSGVSHAPSAAAAGASTPSPSISTNLPAPSTPTAGPYSPAPASTSSPGTPAAAAAAEGGGVEAAAGTDFHPAQASSSRQAAAAAAAPPPPAAAAAAPPSVSSSLPGSSGFLATQDSNRNRSAAEAAAIATHAAAAATGLYAGQQQQHQLLAGTCNSSSEIVDAAAGHLNASSAGAAPAAAHVALTIQPHMPEPAATATAEAGTCTGPARSAAAV